MIRRHIQADTDCRAKILDRLKLKARQLGNRPTVVHGGLGQAQQRSADIAANLRRYLCIFEQFADQRRRRRLSIRSGDADDSAFHKPVRKLDFANDLAILSVNVAGRDRICRHAGRYDDQIDLIKQPRWNVAGHQANVMHGFERAGLVGPFLDRLFVMQNGNGAPSRKEFCRRYAGFPCSQNQCFSTFDFHQINHRRDAKTLRKN